MKEDQKRVLPFLRRVYLSRRELRQILEFLSENFTEEDMNSKPWKKMLHQKISKHYQKSRKGSGEKEDE